MYYLKITALPLLREDVERCYPIVEIVQRLCNDDVIEIRIYRENQATHICLGLPSALMVAQATLGLESKGFVCRTVATIKSVSTKTILYRKVDKCAIPQVGTAPLVELLPTELKSKNIAIMNALAHMQNECGVAILLQRAKGMDSGTLARLRSQAIGSNFVQDLMKKSGLVQAVICVFGIQKQVELLTAECAFAHGLEIKTLSGEMKVHPSAFAEVERLLTPLERCFTMQEVQILTDVLAFASPYGIPYNKDTLMGEKFPIPVVSGEHIRLGLSASGEPIDIPMKLLRQHLVLTGAPGTGKGNEMFGIVMQLHQAGIPFLVIESAKEEFHHLSRVIPELRTWRPTEQEYVFSPFTIPEKVTLQDYRASLLQMLRVAFHLDGPLEELFSDTLNRCFAKYGYTDNTCGNVRGIPFGIHEFMLEYSDLLNSGGYSAKTKSDMKTAGLVRLKRLMSQNPAVFDSAVSIPISELAKGENLLQLNCLTTIEAKQMFATLLLISLSAWLRITVGHCSDRPLRFVILMDESHNLLNTVTDSHGDCYSFADDFQNLLLEMRSVGIGFVVADQSTRNIPKGITDICATKIFMGASNASGITDYMDDLNIDEKAISHLYLMNAGEGCCRFQGVPHAVFFQTTNLIDHFHLDKPCSRRNDYLRSNSRLTIETFQACGECPSRGCCTHNDKVLARQRAMVLYQQYGTALEQLLLISEQEPESKQKMLKLRAALLTAARSKNQSRASTYCTLIQFVRLFNRECRVRLNMTALLEDAKRVYK